MKKTIILLSGKAGVGKDTFAEMLGGAWERISFADAVKEECSTLADLHMDFFHKRELKDSPVFIGGKLQTPRDLCISVGGYYRGIDPKYWTNKAVEKIRNSNSNYIVITDWRFPNELEAIKQAFLPDLDGYYDECQRINEDYFARNAESPTMDLRTYPKKPEATAEITTVRLVGSNNLGSSDESECALDSFSFDYFISNRSDLTRLKGKATALGAIVGEEGATTEVYNELYPHARNLCRKHIPNQSDIDDLTQEALLEVLRQIPKKFNFSSRLWSFAYKVVYYYAQNFRRKRQTFTNTFHLSWDGGDSLFDSGKNDLHDHLLGEQIEEALSSLSASDRRLFELRYAGWAHKDIGAEIGITENYSRRRLFALLRKLRQKLGDFYSDLI